MLCCFPFPATSAGDMAASLDSIALELIATERRFEELYQEIAVPDFLDREIKSPCKPMPSVHEDKEMEEILRDLSELVKKVCPMDESEDSVPLTDKSVDEILKETEELVSMSLARLDSLGSHSCDSDRKTDQVSRLSLTKPTSSLRISSVKFADDPETIPFQDTSLPFRDVRDAKVPSTVERLEGHSENVIPLSTPPQTKSTQLENGKKLSDRKKELKLSDLTTVYETGTTPETPGDRIQALKTGESLAPSLAPLEDNEDVLSGEDVTEDPIKAEVKEKIDNSFLWNDSTNLNNNNEVMIEKKVEPGGEVSVEGGLAVPPDALQLQLKSQLEVISSYQKENERLCADIISAKETWRETEKKLLEKVHQAEQSKAVALTKANHEIFHLKNKLKQAEESINNLQLELQHIKVEKVEMESLNEDLSNELTRLDCEVIEYKQEMVKWQTSEKEKLAALENNAALQSQLSQANAEITRKSSEIARLNGVIGQLRGELEKIRLGSVINQTAENLTGTISQLQAALAFERDNSKEISKEKDTMTKEMLDLRRQVKEMENIIIKRSKSGSHIQLGDSFHADTLEYLELEKKNKALLSELSQTQELLAEKQKALGRLQEKYDQDIGRLKQELEKAKKESAAQRHAWEERERAARAVKEDAHLLATIRGLKAEISSRDKDIVKLNRELDDVRKTNKRLQKEREKALNPSKYRGVIPTKDAEKPQTAAPEQGPSRDYNPSLYDGQENVLFLRTENKNLKEEIKKLEQDLISLHNKRIQDLSALQEQHELEIARVMKEQSSKHSSSTVSHLQSQLYTQQMVIRHLKEQLHMLEERAGEATLLKAERDHLENSLIEANKKISRLQQLQSPEAEEYGALRERLDYLERRHAMREERLEALARELLAKQGQGTKCPSLCEDKLLAKNQEICYYKAELDRILSVLGELTWS